MEVNRPEVDPQLVAEDIAEQLEKRASFRRTMKRAIDQTMEDGAKGVRIQLAGRLGGAEMARNENGMAGSIPLSTLRARIEYGFAEAKTAQGNIGIKVWINNGDYLTRDRPDARHTACAPSMPQYRIRRRHAANAQAGKVPQDAARHGQEATPPAATRSRYGDFGLQSLEGGWLSAEAIEAGRITATHSVRGEGRLYIRVFPHKSVTAIPAETRMGKGKGEPEYWAAVVKPGMMLFEIGRPARGGGPRLPGPRGLQDAVQVPVRDAAAEYLIASRFGEIDKSRCA